MPFQIINGFLIGLAFPHGNPFAGRAVGLFIMKTVTISLNSIDKVKAFVNDITKFDSDFDLVSGRYVIDAKSIMGIFSLDLSKPIDLNIHSEDDVNAILDVLKPYLV